MKENDSLSNKDLPSVFKGAVRFGKTATLIKFLQVTAEEMARN